MRFRQWRADRQLRKELEPEEYAALKQADAQYTDNMARLMALEERRAKETIRRIRRAEASGLDPYFRAVVCYCIEAGANMLREFATEAHVAGADPNMESPPDELWSFIHAYENDEKWAAALDIATWAHLACFVRANYPAEFDARISAASKAIGPPAHSQEIVEAARSLDYPEESMTPFVAATFECAHLRTVGTPPSAPNTLDYAMALWRAGWDAGVQTVNERLDDYEARGA